MVEDISDLQIIFRSTTRSKEAVEKTRGSKKKHSPNRPHPASNRCLVPVGAVLKRISKLVRHFTRGIYNHHGQSRVSRTMTAGHCEASRESVGLRPD